MSDQIIDYPPGDYAIVELFGHQTLVGRVTEVERFGTKMLALEAIYRSTLLPATLHGGASIYRMTPCDAETAFRQQPRHDWQLPASLRTILPPIALPAASDDLDVERDVFGADIGDQDDADG